VGDPVGDWVWCHLFTPLDVFEAQMRLLAEEGWHTIRLDELYAHMARGEGLPEKPVVLTFDDGYLDNYVLAYPIIRKYGHRAVIWMSTDFIDPSEDPRATLEDAWSGRVRFEELDTAGFLSLAEMRLMERSGHIEIQSHARTHTWYFAGPEIVDFHRPAGLDGYRMPPWLAWNDLPDRKHEYPKQDIERLVPYGRPVYRHGKALVTPRYFEDERTREILVDHVRRSGGEAFFRRGGWREELLGIARSHVPRADRVESREEYRERVREELSQSKRILEEGLGKSIDFLCWPGGGRSPETIGIAMECGYRATTTHYFDRERKNIYGQDPSEINRIGCGSPWAWRGKTFIRTDPEFFTASLGKFAGDAKSSWRVGNYKLKYILRYLLGLQKGNILR
jgi:peptidoglycan/xylan/chitin deacetylase (PgdA/CDA1 family)